MQIFSLKSIAVFSICWAITGCGDRNIGVAKTAIEEQLLDPQSVQYKNIKSYSENTVCGEVNSKNRYGGYVGFESFVFREGRVELDASSETKKVWCNNETHKHLTKKREEFASYDRKCADRHETSESNCARAAELREELNLALQNSPKR
jgi:hypothetical protein